MKKILKIIGVVVISIIVLVIAVEVFGSNSDSSTSEDVYTYRVYLPNNEKIADYGALDNAPESIKEATKKVQTFRKGYDYILSKNEKIDMMHSDNGDGTYTITIYRYIGMYDVVSKFTVSISGSKIKILNAEVKTSIFDEDVDIFEKTTNKEDIIGAYYMTFMTESSFMSLLQMSM